MDARSDPPPPTPAGGEYGGAAPVIRPYQPGDEQQIAEVLRICHPHSWGSQDRTSWRWKHTDRPGFTPADVMVATVDGKVVACFHSAVLPLQLEPGLTVRASFDGDFAVLPEHRGRDLSAQVYDITDPRLLKRGVIFRGGFTSRELNERFYGKRFGYLFVPEAQITFRKIIGLAPLQEKLATLGQRLLARPRLRHVLRDRPFVVNMLVEGFPPAHVEMTATGFSLRGGHVVAPDLRVRMPYNALLGFVAGPRLLLQHAVAALLTGRFWVAGLTRSGTRLIAIWWALIRRS